MPELAHQGIFQFSRLSLNCYVKTVEKYPPVKPYGFYESTISITACDSQDHGGSHKNFMKIFLEKLSFYGVKLFKDKKNITLDQSLDDFFQQKSNENILIPFLASPKTLIKSSK